MPNLLLSTDAGLYCPAGDFYVDPWAPVRRAIITHAHADHARPGSTRYLAHHDSLHLLQARLGPDAVVDTIAYSESVTISGVTITLHPAGHVLGSSQVRIEQAGEVWVVSGDYKTEADTTCTAFESLKCHTFVTESTFGLPIYRWREQSQIFQEINHWWQTNAAQDRISLIYAYSLGKSQRIIGGVDSTIGPIFCHGAVERMNQAYRATGVSLPATQHAGQFDGKNKDAMRALIIAPPSARATPWLRRFGDFASGFASGWMQIRGARRRRTVERGFVLSDHADWPALLSAIHETQAERVLVTHGSIGPMVRWLNEHGISASSLHTEFEGEQDEVEEPPDTTEQGSS